MSNCVEVDGKSIDLDNLDPRELPQLELFPKEYWFEGLNLKLKKKATPFRFFYEQFRLQQDMGRLPSELPESFLAFLRCQRGLLRRLQRDGADIGYVLSIMFDAEIVNAAETPLIRI